MIFTLLHNIIYIYIYIYIYIHMNFCCELASSGVKELTMKGLYLGSQFLFLVFLVLAIWGCLKSNSPQMGEFPLVLLAANRDFPAVFQEDALILQTPGFKPELRFLHQLPKDCNPNWVVVLVLRGYPKIPDRFWALQMGC